MGKNEKPKSKLKLLINIAIALVIVAIPIVAFMAYTNYQKRKAFDAHQLKMIYTEILSYKLNGNPEFTHLSQVIPANNSLIDSPILNDSGFSTSTTPASQYRYGDYIITYHPSLWGASSSIVGFTATGDGDGRNVVFGDGRAIWHTDEEFKTLIKESNEMRTKYQLPLIDLSKLQ